MKFKNSLRFLIYFVIIFLSVNNTNFNIYANNYKIAMQPVPPKMNCTYPKPYSWNLAEEMIFEESQKAGLEFSKPKSEFTINKCFFLYPNPIYYSEWEYDYYYQSFNYYINYLNNVQIKPDYIDYKNKIAILIQDKNNWYKKYIPDKTTNYTYYSDFSSFITEKSQIIKEPCEFDEYANKDEYYVIFVRRGNFMPDIKIENIRQSITDIFNTAKEYKIDSDYCNKIKSETKYDTYEEAYQDIYNHIYFPERDGTPYNPPYIERSSFKFSAVKADSPLEINNCFAIFYDKSYYTYYNKFAAYDLYTTRYYLKNINIVPDFVDEKNKVAILLYDKDNWDNEENSNPNYFIDNIKNSNTKTLKTEDEYKNYLNNNEYYLIVLNRKNFIKFINQTTQYSLLLDEMGLVVEQYRNQN